MPQIVVLGALDLPESRDRLAGMLFAGLDQMQTTCPTDMLHRGSATCIGCRETVSQRRFAKPLGQETAIERVTRTRGVNGFSGCGRGRLP